MPPFFLLFIVSFLATLSGEENFLLTDGATDAIVLEIGPHTEERMTPCSTFKIALSLMGYDEGILKGEKTPIWDFQEGYDDDLESWKTSQNPQSWMKHSCIWYSRLLARQLGTEKMQNYLRLFEYGNQDISGGLQNAWLSSSLKISIAEQVCFIKKMLHRELPLSAHALEMTKQLLFKEELPDGWKLYGKTGLGTLSYNLKVRWFIGWMEKEGAFFPFAYNLRDEEIDCSLTIPRVKKLLETSQLMRLTQLKLNYRMTF